MRFALVALVVLGSLLSGCSSKTSLDCPPYVTAEEEQMVRDLKEQYDQAAAQARDQGVEEIPPWPDSDGDCIFDVAETALGSDPNDQASFPTEAQWNAAIENGTLPGQTPTVPEPIYTWHHDTASGEFTTTLVVAPGGQGGFEVPDGAVRLLANFTITGTLPGEVSVRLNPPSCAGNPQCTAIPEQTTQGGVTSFDVEEPEAGTYSVSIFAADGAQTGTWDAVLASQILLSGAPA